eukprot:1137516-Pleurochrysis_carterae.AAC.1
MHTALALLTPSKKGRDQLECKTLASPPNCLVLNTLLRQRSAAPSPQPPTPRAAREVLGEVEPPRLAPPCSRAAVSKAPRGVW